MLDSGLWLVVTLDSSVRPLPDAHIMRSLRSWDIAAMGASFAFTETAVANVREKNDPLNGVAGGCAAGFLAGVRGTVSCCLSRC